MARRIGILFAMAACAAAFAACEGDSGTGSTCPTCADACKHIYVTCNKSVLDESGAQMSQAQCTAACTGASDGKAVAECVVKVADCGDEGLMACIQNPPAATCGTTTGTKPPHTTDRGGVMHGTGSGTPTNPGTCATCHDGTKAPACSDCH